MYWWGESGVERYRTWTSDWDSDSEEALYGTVAAKFKSRRKTRRSHSWICHNRFLSSFFQLSFRNLKTWSESPKLPVRMSSRSLSSIAELQPSLPALLKAGYETMQDLSSSTPETLARGMLVTGRYEYVFISHWNLFRVKHIFTCVSINPIAVSETYEPCLCNEWNPFCCVHGVSIQQVQHTMSPCRQSAFRWSLERTHSRDFRAARDTEGEPRDSDRAIVRWSSRASSLRWCVSVITYPTEIHNCLSRLPEHD